MSHDQLELQFGERASGAPTQTAKLIVFPVSRRVKKIRACAKTLGARKSVEAKQACWDRVVLELQAELRRRGCAYAEISRQIDEFRTAVGVELGRIENQANPRGAA